MTSKVCKTPDQRGHENVFDSFWNCKQMKNGKTVSSPGSLNISMNGLSYLWQHIDKVTKNKKKNNQWNEAHSKFAVNTLKGEFHKIV